MKTIMAVAFMVLCSAAYGQSYRLKGQILDENAKPLLSAAVVPLDPADSTMLYFSVTGNDGMFGLNNVKTGSYLLQASIVGYSTLYRNMSIPSQTGEDVGTIIMIPKVYKVDDVVVSRERIPLKMNRDTIEYDARAFKVKPDAVAEELLKKLPGVEVDRAGNIKAMGEDVKNILVDGKEFFGSDPKVATRNLPADAINKVQLFDKQSDESDFTGIDDGERNPTMNIVLDEKKKRGVFGDVTAGGGPGGHIAASGKMYRFTGKIQLAALGMYNNINQFGFSLGDYLNFSGGIGSFSSGEGHVMIGGENSFPVNFGQPVYGTGSNGAAGLNFSVSNARKDRFFASYLGNGSKRNLSETSITQNYTPDGTFIIDESKDQVRRDTAHRFNFGFRKQIGERQKVIMNGAISYNTGSNPLNSVAGSYLDEVKINGQERTISELTSRLSGNADASYLIRINEGKTILKASGRASYSGSNSESRFHNRTEYLNPYLTDVSSQFLDMDTHTGSYSGSLSLTQRISKLAYLDFSATAGYTKEDLRKRQGDIEGGMEPDDLLSPDFYKNERYIRPGLVWKRSTTGSQLAFGLQASLGEFSTILDNDNEMVTEYFYFLPRASWEWDYRSGRRLMLAYSSSVNTPRASQLLPVVNNINALSLFYGNRDLKPEYNHTVRATWWLFDQFSFTTLLAGVNATYTHDKIGYFRNVDDNLIQTITLINLTDNWNAGGDIDLSTPIRPLGVKINMAFNEEYNRGISIINGKENINNSLTHKVSLTVDNRKKEKWDIETGTAVTVTNSKYTVQRSLDNTYYDLSWFAEGRFTPNANYSFMVSADITSYSAKSFNEKQLVPLIGAEINYYFMKNQRATLTLAGVDLLNRNTGIERSGELNYLVERRSDMIGRYVLLSFKFRLNKIGEGKGGIDVQVRRR